MVWNRTAKNAHRSICRTAVHFFSVPVISKVYDFFFIIDYNHFSLNNLLSSSQFGFRSSASTQHALLKFSDDILKLFDWKKVAIATFMDLSKAFDCMYHNILLSKLKRYGIHETALQWINSYLSDREHLSPGTRLTHLYLT